MVKGEAQAQAQPHEDEYYDDEEDGPEDDEDSHEPAQGTQQNVAVAGRKNDDRKI